MLAWSLPAQTDEPDTVYIGGDRTDGGNVTINLDAIDDDRRAIDRTDDRDRTEGAPPRRFDLPGTARDGGNLRFPPPQPPRSRLLVQPDAVEAAPPPRTPETRPAESRPPDRPAPAPPTPPARTQRPSVAVAPAPDAKPAPPALPAGSAPAPAAKPPAPDSDSEQSRSTAPETDFAAAPKPPLPPEGSRISALPTVPLTDQVAQSQSNQDTLIEARTDRRDTTVAPPPSKPNRPTQADADADAVKQAEVEEERDSDAEEEPEDTQTAARPPADAPAGDASLADGLRLSFAAESAELSADAEETLAALAERMAEAPGLRIQLTAYADGSEETASRARRLSLSRALSVRSFLIDRGIRSTRIDVRALGNEVEGGPPDRVDIAPARR